MEAQAQYTIISVYDGEKGKDGISVSTILYYYLATDTPVMPDASSITSESIPETSPSKRYLWKKTVTIFDDPSKPQLVSVDIISIYGQTGGQGPQGETEVFRISLASDNSDYRFKWTKEDRNTSVILELQNSLGSDAVWTATASGISIPSVIQAVSGKQSQRNISLTGVTNEVRKTVMESDCIAIRVTASYKGKDYTASYEIRVLYDEMPAPMYCGMVTSLLAINTNRQEKAFANGDYVLYVGESADSVLVKNESKVEKNNLYEYSFDDKLWIKANTASHTFGALSDILDRDSSSYDKNAAYQIIAKLAASSIVAENITVDTARIKGKLNVSRLSTEMEDGSPSITIQGNEISSTSSDGSRSWSLGADGNASFRNVDVSGSIKANNVDHVALKTFEASTLSGASAVENWTAPKDTWSDADAFLNATKNYHAVSWSGYTHLGKSVDIVCVGNGVPSPGISSSLTGTQAQGQAMAIGTQYSNSKTVYANSGAWNIYPLLNTQSHPLYIEASCSLGGNMNDIYVEFWNQQSDTTKLQKGRNWSGWIMPGQLVGIYGHSWAWWGEQTGTGNIKVYENDGEPYLGYQKFDDYLEATAPNTQDTSKQYVRMKTLTVPTGTKIIRLFAVNAALNTNNVCIEANGQYIYNYAKASNGDYLFDVSNVPAGTSIYLVADITPKYSSGDEDTDPYYYDYSINMRMVSVFYYNTFNGLQRIMIRLASGEVSYIYPSNNNQHVRYHIQSAEPTSIPGFTSSSYLYYVSGNSVIAKLASIGIGYGKTVECSTTATSSATFTSVVESKQYSISSLVNVTLSSNRLQFYKSGTESQHIYAKGQGDNANIGVYSSVNLRLYLVGGNTRIQTQQIVPFSDNTYSIGTSANKYKELFSYSGNIQSLISSNMSVQNLLTIGTEGVDWYIGDTSGYITLSSGLIIQWGTNTTANTWSKTFTVNFPLSFPHSCLTVVCTLKAVAGKTPDGNWTNVINDDTTNTYFRWSSYYNQNGCRWIAIGY